MAEYLRRLLDVRLGKWFGLHWVQTGPLVHEVHPGTAEQAIQGF